MKKNDYISKFNYAVIISTLLFMYVFPMSLFSKKDLFVLNRMIFNIVLIVLYIVYMHKRKIKPSKTDIVILLFMVTRFLLTKDFESFGLFYLLIIPHLNFEKINLNSKKLMVLLAFSVLFYSVFHGYYFSNYLISTSIGEINQVGFSILMLFFIFKINDYKWLAIISLIAGTLTQSRNFILAILIYIITSLLLKFLEKKQYKLKIPTNFRFYSYGSIFVVIILYFLFSTITDGGQFASINSLLGKSVSFIDHSNFLRFVANIAVLKFYMLKPMYLLTGVPYKILEQYLLTYSLGFGQFSKKVVPPHNYYFKFLYKFGVFSIFIFYLTSKEIDKRLNVENLPIFFTFLLYAVFLGTGFYEGYLIIFIYLLDQYNARKVLST